MPYKIAQKYMMDSVGYMPTICWLVVTVILAIVVGGIVETSVGRTGCTGMYGGVYRMYGAIGCTDVRCHPSSA